MATNLVEIEYGGRRWLAEAEGNELHLIKVLPQKPPAPDPILEAMSKALGRPVPGIPSAAVDPQPPTEEVVSLELERVTQPISDSVFRARLSSIMTDNKFDRRLKHRTRGKLDMTHLPKAKTGAQAVFTQKQARKGKQYNVVLVVDESGSMEHPHLVDGVKTTRARVAGEAAAFLGAHLPGLVELAILGFNHTVEVHKAFEQQSPVDLAEAVVDRAAGPGHGCNHDYEALEKAYELLKGRPGKNLVIFLSDGEPAQCIGDFANYSTEKNDKRVIQRLVQAHADVQTFGVGLFVPSDQIPVNFTINGLEELKPKILDTLNQHIKRG